MKMNAIAVVNDEKASCFGDDLKQINVGLHVYRISVYAVKVGMKFDFVISEI